MGSIHKLILYKDFGSNHIFRGIAWLIGYHALNAPEKEDMATQYYSCLHDLIELSESHGFYGNLWHTFLAYLLVNNENAYSRACEIRGEVKGTISQIALHDFSILKNLFDFDFTLLEKTAGLTDTAFLTDYKASSEESGGKKLFHIRIRDRILELAAQLNAAADAQAFAQAVTAFYRDFGAGKLGLHKAFRVAHTKEGAQIIPVTNIAHVTLDDLVGYETAKKKLLANTEAFVNGRQANNCLLFGDAGTGKSTSIKAIANQYYAKGLRMIELYKHQFEDLHAVISQIKNRNYKFIIYMDDLSFEDFEVEYKYLKAVIEGGLEKKPENVLIYATSNRRHLIREKFSDKAQLDDDLHNNDTVQEKLSLAARFGVQIYFGAPDKKEFSQIVTTLAAQHGVVMDEQELLLEANKWELGHGGRSGRTAQQFINYLLGK